MTSDTVAHWLLRGLGLPVTNLIASSGGHFLLLAPQAAPARLPDLRRDLIAWLLDVYHGDLYISLAGTSIPIELRLRCQ